MNGNEQNTNESTLKKIMKSFIGSYTERDKSLTFPSWLSKQLQQEMPEMSFNESDNLSEEIIDSVESYDQTLNELNISIENGKSKENWLADKMSKLYSDMPLNEAGDVLQYIDVDLNETNTLLMQDIGEAQDDVVYVQEAEYVEWNQYNLKDKALNIGRQAAMSGLGVAAGIIKTSIDDGGISDIGSTIGLAFQEGLATSVGEVKAVVAGAVKTAVHNGLTDILPQDVPVETISDIAGAAVESANALFYVATGKNTIMEALDKIGRASVVTACRMGSSALKGTISRIPVVGPLVVNLAGGLLNHMKSPKFSEGVYGVVRDAAVATWNGIKESGKKIFNNIKNSIKSIVKI